MRTQDFDYHLPPELIAQTPVEPRDASRLLVLDRASGAVAHRQFTDIVDCLPAGAVLVLNRSRVIPARLYGRRKDSGGRVELLLLRREAPGIWQALGKPGRRLRPGATITLEPCPESPIPQVSEGPPPAAAPAEPSLTASVEAVVLSMDGEGVRRLRLSDESAIEALGEMPLPPYIHWRLQNPERYQTVFPASPAA